MKKRDSERLLKVRREKMERLKDDRIIHYPYSFSEAEVMFFLYKELKDKGLDVRAEVTSKNLASRFDLVIFEDKIPIRIIEVKRGKNTKKTPGQLSKYREYGVPVDFVRGIAEAEKYVGQTFDRVWEDKTRVEAKPAKKKVKKEGDPCRKCGTPVVLKEGGKSIKPGQVFYYRKYLRCDCCGTFYMLNNEKVYL